MSSCNNDEVLDSSISTKLNEKPIIKKSSFADLLRTNARFSSLINKYGLNSHSNEPVLAARGENSEKFTVDTSMVKEVISDGYNSFTMSIRRDSISPNYFENLVVQIDSLGNEEAYIIKYNHNGNIGVKNEHNERYVGGTIDLFLLVTDSTGEESKQIACNPVLVVYCNWHGIHVAGPQCYIEAENDPDRLFTVWESPSDCEVSSAGGDGGAIAPSSHTNNPIVMYGTGASNPDNGGGPITAPVVNDYLLLLGYLGEDNLSSEAIFWMQHNGNADEVGAIMDFILVNSPLDQSTLDSLLTLIENISGNETIVEGPDIPIEDIVGYLSCFDKNSDAQITVYADQSDPNNPNSDYWASLSVGHSFVTITQGNKTLSFGFYPESGVGYFSPSDGIMGNNENHDYDVSVSLSINSEILTAVIDHTIDFADSSYSLQSNNCTDFAIEVSNIVGLDVPASECRGNYVIGAGSTPGKFGEYLEPV